MKTPILLILWRRPQCAKKLINALRPVAPQQLFLACDGPSKENNQEKNAIQETLAVVESEIDWPCEIKRLYSKKNHGCRIGVTRAINWFFDHVVEGIILEDDCIPHPDFFPYCTELLERYRHDTRVWSICGSNFQQGQRRGSASYYFSIHGDSWGWATWRRAWKYYPMAEERWFDFRDANRLVDVFPITQEQHYWHTILDQLFLDKHPSAWDYQWWLAGWMNNALHIWPNSCLISNIGFANDGSNTFGDDPFAALPLEPLGELTHPPFLLADREADSFAFMHRRGGKRLLEARPWDRLILWVRAIRQVGLVKFAGRRLHHHCERFIHKLLNPRGASI